jgi:hypothetical protein
VVLGKLHYVSSKRVSANDAEVDFDSPIPLTLVTLITQEVWFFLSSLPFANSPKNAVVTKNMLKALIE